MRKQVERMIDELCNEVDKVDWSDREIYAAFCAQTFYYSRQTTRILALGASRMKIEEASGYERYLKHLHEETNHELLSVRDCQALGHMVDGFPELAVTKAFYQTQFYMMGGGSPWSFLGYALILEGLAVTKAIEMHDAVVKHHGPKSASFLKVHGEEDEDHFPQAIKMLESRVEHEQAAILESARMTAGLYCSILRELPLAVRAMRRSSKAA